MMTIGITIQTRVTRSSLDGIESAKLINTFRLILLHFSNNFGYLEVTGYYHNGSVLHSSMLQKVLRACVILALTLDSKLLPHPYLSLPSYCSVSTSR